MISFSRLKKNAPGEKPGGPSFLVSLCILNSILNPKFVSITGKKCTKAQNKGDV